MGSLKSPAENRDASLRRCRRANLICSLSLASFAMTRCTPPVEVALKTCVVRFWSKGMTAARQRDKLDLLAELNARHAATRGHDAGRSGAARAAHTHPAAASTSRSRARVKAT